MIKRKYVYRLYPSRKQEKILLQQLEACKELYNHLLETSKRIYEEDKKILRRYDFDKYTKTKPSELLYSQVKQNVSDRVHKSFQHFFRRIQDPACKKKGFPRFKSKAHSLTYPQHGFKIIGKKLLCSKIGNISIKLHRNIEGKIKTLTIKQNAAGQWFAVFSCEISSTQLPFDTHNPIGIDLGIEHFATLSTGGTIANPRYLLKSEKKLKQLQKSLTNKVKNSNNRLKAKKRLAKQHITIKNQRTDFLHKASQLIVSSYNPIIVEQLNVSGMLCKQLSKHIHDASWKTFVRFLEYKALARGSELIKVSPKNTSKSCSKCRFITDMPLQQRKFICPSCGLIEDRDLNAAKNILLVGLDKSKPNACESPFKTNLLAVVDEPGTIRGELN